MTNPEDKCPGAPYTLRVTDRAGCTHYIECTDWLDVHIAVTRHSNPGRCILDLFGTDHDLDSDGLTEQEREAFEELI